MNNSSVFRVDLLNALSNSLCILAKLFLALIVLSFASPTALSSLSKKPPDALLKISKADYDLGLGTDAGLEDLKAQTATAIIITKIAPMSIFLSLVVLFDSAVLVDTRFAF